MTALTTRRSPKAPSAPRRSHRRNCSVSSRALVGNNSNLTLTLTMMTTMRQSTRQRVDSSHRQSSPDHRKDPNHLENFSSPPRMSSKMPSFSTSRFDPDRSSWRGRAESSRSSRPIWAWRVSPSRRIRINSIRSRNSSSSITCKAASSRRSSCATFQTFTDRRTAAESHRRVKSKPTSMRKNRFEMRESRRSCRTIRVQRRKRNTRNSFEPRRTNVSRSSSRSNSDSNNRSRLRKRRKPN